MIFQTNELGERGSLPALSVVMIGHRSAELLAKAIESLVRHCPGEWWDLVLVVNGSDTGVNEFANKLLANAHLQLPVTVVKLTERRPGAARNAGVRAARAPLIFFLDDDIECFQNVLLAAVELFGDLTIDVAGGANLTPPNSPALARATGAVMATYLGAARMRRRYCASRDGATNEHGLILCNLAVRRALFERERGFACHLISNEENVFLQRLASRGANLWSSPRLAVFHRRRETWRGLVAQAAKYGSGRAQNLLLVPESFRPLYLLPTILLLYLALAVALVAAFGPLALLPAALYGGLSAAQAAFLAARKRDSAQILGAIVLPTVHVAYGYGFLRTLLAWTRRREELLEHSASGQVVSGPPV